MIKQKKILIIDDNELLKEVIADYLSSLNAVILMAADGKEGFMTTEAERPDIIITDMTMHGGSGIEMLNKISLLANYKPKVFVTTGVMDLNIEEFKKFNVIKIFEKPFDSKIFINTISSYL